MSLNYSYVSFFLFINNNLKSFRDNLLDILGEKERYTIKDIYCSDTHSFCVLLGLDHNNSCVSKLNSNKSNFPAYLQISLLKFSHTFLQILAKC